MRTQAFAPTMQATGEAADFVEETLLASGCPMPLAVRMCIVVDEMFSNIARYSGATRAEISCGLEDGCILLRLLDDGIPYDPTLKDRPNTALPAQERAVGGLGIHMVRSFVDDMAYERTDGWNNLTLRKRITQKKTDTDG